MPNITMEHTPTNPTTVANTYPISATQERLWFLQSLLTENESLNVVTVRVFEEAIENAQLKSSMLALIDVLPLLSHAMDAHGNTPQFVAQDIAVEDVLTIETVASDDLEARIDTLSQHVFDLEHAPLMRSTALKTSEAVYLVFVAHRILLDRRSLTWVANAVVEHCLNGTSLTLKHLASHGEASAEAMDWWGEYLENVTPLEFPIDAVRPPTQNYATATHTVSIEQATWDALKAFASTHQISVETMVGSAFATLLYRYTNADDLIFGWQTRNHPQDGVGQAIGQLENLVSLRLQLTKDTQFTDLMTTLSQTMADNAGQFVPFARLLQVVNVERDLSRAPLLQIAFEWLGETADVATLTSDLLDYQLLAFESEGQLHLRFEYDNAIFSAESIALIAEHMTVLLGSIADNPDQAISAFTLMSDTERHKLLVEWNDTAVDYPHTTCLHQLIEEQVARTPERIAVISGDEQVTFAELNERANRYAHYLQSVGIQPDDLVGVHLQRNVDMLVAVLAIMKSGGAYVPLDPMFPIDRLNMICEDAAIKVLITHSEIEAYAPEHEAEQIVIDTIDVSGFSTENPTSDVTPDNLVYIIFTSGSTGRPKGVQLQHRSVVNFLLSMQNEPGLIQDDVLLAVTTLSFDIAVLELYLPLLTGAQVVIARQEEVVDGRRLLEMIDEYKITLLQATPATWRLLLEADWDSTPNMTALCGGEALPLDLAKQITARCKALWNMYGPTETTVWSTVEPIGDVKDFISIGHPIHNTSVYVLDSADNLAPIGVPGELTIGGDGLARGYFERPKLNAEKFVPDPFVAQTTLAQRDAAIEQPRMYRTGDVARYLPDGRLQFYGRVDHQVKVRGFRIELGEIETNLGKHPHIEQNVVIVREDTPGDKQIVAYLVMADGQVVKPQDIREHLKQHLPNYMIPSVFVGLDTFPLTPNGKINRRALPKPEIADMTTEQVYVAPTNETEATVAKIWADALNVERVGIDDNFFDLGGHSILAIRIFTQIEKTFGQSLPLAALFRAPTVKDFAALLGDMNSETLDSLRSGVVPIRTTGSAPNFFIVGGGVINMNNLARNLGDEHPFYALQFQSLSEDDIMHGTVEKAATEFIKMMRGVQPEGPYYIGGSFASIVFAIEMARQLEAEGEDIAMLVAFDPIVNTFLPPRKFNKPKKSLSQRIKTRLDDYLSSEDIRERFIDDWDTFWERVQHRMWKVSFKFYDAINKPIPTWMRTGIYEEFCILRTHKVYNPSKYDGDVVLYVTPPNLEKFVAYEKYGFVNLVAGEVTVAQIPGDPCSIMMEPNVQTLALKLREQIIAIDTNK